MMKWGAVVLMVIFVSIDATARVQEPTNKVGAIEAQGKLPRVEGDQQQVDTSAWGPTGSSETPTEMPTETPTETSTGRENGVVLIEAAEVRFLSKSHDRFLLLRAVRALSLVSFSSLSFPPPPATAAFSPPPPSPPPPSLRRCSQLFLSPVGKITLLPW